MPRPNDSPFVLRDSLKEVIPVLILTVGAVLVSLPLLWMFSTSLRPSSESYKLPPQWLPTQFHFENYGALFNSSVPFFTLFLNSLKITIAVTGGQLARKTHKKASKAVSIFCKFFLFKELNFTKRTPLR